MPLARNAMYTLLCAGFVVMAGCNQPAATPVQPPAGSSYAPAPTQTAAPQQAAYTPPSADQLYQMVAPIALFPDKLVAQVLAGATYPDQITAADQVVDQNPNLQGASLQTAIAQQPWDPSVKGLTVFPSVLDQMAQNIDWTTSLGEAYANDPTDVMNAIQVMRQRASAHGTLRSSSKLTVQTQTVTPVDYGSSTTETTSYSVVPPPSQVIEIQPADPETVYVPQYNPQVVYGEEIPYYPGYTYVQPRGYSGTDLVVAGAIGFGAAILVGSLFDHHHYGYGWNNWGMHWGGYGGGYGGGGRPAVVYNNNTYVSHSTTIINRNVTNNYNNNNYNRTVNNINNNRNVGNTFVNNRPGVGPNTIGANGRPNAFAPRGVPGTPNFGANAARAGLPAEPGMRNLPGNNPAGMARANGPVGPHGPMSMPHFNGVPRPGMTTAQSERLVAHLPPQNPARANMGNMANVRSGEPGMAPHREPMNQFNSAAAHPMQAMMHGPGMATAPQRAAPAPEQHAMARPAEERRFNPPPQQRMEQQPRALAAAPRPVERPMEQRPMEQRPMERPMQQARPMAEPPRQAMHQEAPRPQAQPHPEAHGGGEHPAEHRKDDKHR